MKKIKTNKSDNKPLIGLEYYQRPFMLISQQYMDSCESIGVPHPIRERFWGVVPPGEYEPNKAQELLYSYAVAIQTTLEKVISNNSLAYFLHLYRRLAPEPIGDDKKPATVFLTRAILESFIQKYAKPTLCSRIDFSANIPVERIFYGLLTAAEFSYEREIVKNLNQLVLTDFGLEECASFYGLEKLAYEFWRVSAALRITGKGASLIVVPRQPYFYDNRSDELDFLVTNFDKRGETWDSSTATGVTYKSAQIGDFSGCIILPAYNVNRLDSDNFDELFEVDPISWTG